VEVVRNAWEAWERGDMQAVYDFYDPAIEWDMSESEVPDMGVYRGHEGVRKFFREWMAPFHDYYAHAEDFTLGSEGVLVRMRQGGRKAALMWRCLPCGSSTDSGLAAPCVSRSTATSTARSKPPGCGSRRDTLSTRRWRLGLAAGA
jgi:hypothetical protein